ncbi:MAG: hypothetical protein U0232_24880 [Thermomicrobiales bacterium]
MCAIAAPWGAGTRDELAAAQPDRWLDTPGDLLRHYPAQLPPSARPAS